MSYRLKIWLPLLLLTGLNVSCTQVQSPEKKTTTEVKVETITPKPAGVYQLAGNSNLPDKTQIRVAAIRYLHPASQASKDLNPKPTYSLLAYEIAEVNQGKWQTQLKLWKPASDGRFQESWQLEKPQLTLSSKPDSEVIFLATLALDTRSEELQRLDQQLRRQGKTLENGVLLTNINDNQRYIQASQTLAIALPTGSTTPPGIRPEDINGGWGDRYLMPPETPSQVKLEMPKNRTTNAPASREEFMQ